ncbi:hypothetical protein VNO77_21738 [Canavalia gladiata]|uniref:Uncharacterized protein n=1 Tax=Canavalia gladiata TaxID=3824 RepID=A0AAN9L6I2_CANGL
MKLVAMVIVVHSTTYHGTTFPTRSHGVPNNLQKALFFRLHLELSFIALSGASHKLNLHLNAHSLQNPSKP